MRISKRRSGTWSRHTTLAFYLRHKVSAQGFTTLYHHTTPYQTMPYYPARRSYHIILWHTVPYRAIP